MELHHLSRIINSIEGKVVVEVGVLSGSLTSRVIRQVQSITDYYCVDPWKTYKEIGQTTDDRRLAAYDEAKWEDIYQRFMKGVYSKFKNKVRVLRETSLDAAKRFPLESVDVVYLDGNHSYKAIKEDIRAWLPKVKKGGIISGHDYSCGWQGVVKGVNEIFGKDNITKYDQGGWSIIVTPELRID